MTLSPVVDAQGRIIGVSSITSDTTERREAERQRRANVRRREVLYRLVDEIARADSAATVCQAAVDALLAGGADRPAPCWPTARARCASRPGATCRTTFGRR